MDTGLNASKVIVHKAGKFLGNKIADAVLSKTFDSQGTIEEIITPP